MKKEDVIQFWFEELSPEDWFKGSKDLDQKIIDRFSSLHARAKQMELSSWRTSAKGRLAEIIILDQFSRNIFRNNAEAFAHDSAALALAQELISLKLDQELKPQEKSFGYMPFMHSESALIHEKAVELFSAPGLELNLEFEHKHKVIIDRFNRYPHRNKILGRISTAEEIEFLKEENSSF